MSQVTDYIAQRCKEDPEFAEAYRIESSKLDMQVQFSQFRKSLGLSQKEVAERTGKPQSTISRIETGEMSPTIELVIEIAAKLGKKVSIHFEDE